VSALLAHSTLSHSVQEDDPIQGFETGFTIQTTNEKKPGIFIVRHPEPTAQLVTLASTGVGEDEPPKKRRQKLPVAV
jgi:hypothetical protein